VYVGVDPYEGFREFVLARGPALSRAAYLLTGNRSSAEELVQAALVKTALRWRRVAQAGSPEAYVRRIIVNEHISWWRRFGRREIADPDPPRLTLADPADGAARRLDLAAALARLPKRQRAVIVLRFYHDLSEVDTAEALGCSVGTVKSQAHRALQRIRPLVDTGTGDDGPVLDPSTLDMRSA
jgi:RNA polymerase sigma-70 factor (sigma-E family)